jgi:hypothetical protein
VRHILRALEELRRELGDDEAVTWQTFLLLRDIAAKLAAGACP